jgi:dTDP-4-dehydrorhamnose 3,5-epimerase
MKVEPLPLRGAYLIHLFRVEDERGVFFKPFNRDLFLAAGIDFEPRESICSVSGKNVLRGMHFQKQPHAQAKLVYCPHGAILDVILDIRPESATYGQYYSIELSAQNGLSLYIPEGFAHGFLSLSDMALTSYLMNREYAPDADSGILWNSFGFDWPVRNPLISERDQGFEIWK